MFSLQSDAGDNFNHQSHAARYHYRYDAETNKYEIVRASNSQIEPDIIGHYKPLEEEESAALTERKLQNLVALMNGRNKLAQLGHITGCRILYHVMNDASADEGTRILFYNVGPEGTSQKNALLHLYTEGVL